MSHETASVAMESLPNELLAHILTRVRDGYRASPRLVCRIWRELTPSDEIDPAEACCGDGNVPYLDLVRRRDAERSIAVTWCRSGRASVQRKVPTRVAWRCS